MFIVIAVFVITMGISLYAAARVKSTYNRYSKVPAGSGYTGASCAKRILEAAGINDVEIVESESFLGDHYDPSHKRLVLSSQNYHGNSASALGVAAHEGGHAVQHKIAYKPLVWRMAAVGVTSYANQIVTWLPLIGLFTGIGGFASQTYLLIMCAGWGAIMLFNLVTLPVEFDASKRATTILNRMSFLGSQEAEVGVRKVLDAAALTYVAAFITSLAYLLMYLLPLLMGRRD